MRAGDAGVSLLGPAGAVVKQLPLLSLAGWQAGGGTLQLALTDGTLWQLACAAATEVAAELDAITRGLVAAAQASQQVLRHP